MHPLGALPDGRQYIENDCVFVNIHAAAAALCFLHRFLLLTDEERWKNKWSFLKRASRRSGAGLNLLFPKAFRATFTHGFEMPDHDRPPSPVASSILPLTHPCFHPLPVAKRSASHCPWN